MIPILYEKTETLFASNGLGRLRDTISAVVTEERNGIYELDFQYPVTGAHYDEITLGRIVGVVTDDTGDFQPFDIVSFTKPIDGVVTFHCVHISYRQSYLTAIGSSISSLSDAFDMLTTAEPSNPFTYWTDKTSTGFMAAADGTPRSVRQMLGGVEGSILDAYGGEYEWDKFSVKLWSARGKARDFTIRYGVNMLEYNDEADSQGTYSSCIPFWKSGDAVVVGNRVDSSGTTVTGRGECVPLDLTEKFETQPTTAQLETLAQSLLNSNSTYLPTQTIKVSFLRLQDMNEYSDFSNLLQCGLCDTIKVIFPDYGTSGQFKIVKTVWDVLMDRYESMELGTLSTTLSEALGISNTLTFGGGGGATADDFVIEHGTSNDWTYRKWDSGVAECWRTWTFGLNINQSYGGIYWRDAGWQNFPTSLFTATPTVTATMDMNGGVGGITCNNITSTGIGHAYIWNGTSYNYSSITVNLYAIGKWK